MCPFILQLLQQPGMQAFFFNDLHARKLLMQICFLLHGTFFTRKRKCQDSVSFGLVLFVSTSILHRAALTSIIWLNLWILKGTLLAALCNLTARCPIFSPNLILGRKISFFLTRAFQTWIFSFLSIVNQIFLHLGYICQ